MTDPADSVDRRPPSEISASGARSDPAEQITGSVSTTDHCPIDPRQVHLGGRVLLAPREVSAPAGTHNLPRPRSAVFAGRDASGAALACVAESGHGVVTHAIQGPGGIGKTELALRHAWTHRDCYSLMWWVVADTAENVDGGLAELAYRLQPLMKTVVTTPEAATWARTWLRTHTRWLLVLDNVEDPQHVTALLGQLDAGRILITTRRDLDWHRYAATPVRLGPLERAESIELLTRLTGCDEPNAAYGVADELRDLPLTLQQAAAYITERRTSISAYLTQLHNQPDLFVDTPALSQPAEQAAARVWHLTMTAISTRNPVATQLMDVLAWIAPDNQPREVLTPVTNHEAELDDALGLLASYSMIIFTNTVSVHRLVQTITRANHAYESPEHDKTTSHPGLTAATQLARAAPPDPLNNVAGWPGWQTLLPHVDALAEHLPETFGDATLISLLNGAATYQQGQGQLTAAIRKFDRAYAVAQRVNGAEHPDTLASAHSLATAYHAAGRLDEAIALHEATHASRRRILGEDHPDTVSSAHNLVTTYHAAGQLDEAIALLEARLRRLWELWI
jgi:tetratricopeptide (TPR) repeat protein